MKPWIATVLLFVALPGVGKGTVGDIAAAATDVRPFEESGNLDGEAGELAPVLAGRPFSVAVDPLGAAGAASPGYPKGTASRAFSVSVQPVPADPAAAGFPKGVAARAFSVVVEEAAVVLEEPVGSFLRGVVAVSWKASYVPRSLDASVTVELHREGTPPLVLGAPGQPLDGSMAWDTTLLPDGIGSLRVVVRRADGGILRSTDKRVTLLNTADVALHHETITSSRTWAAGQVHVVTGVLHVGSGVTLSVEPGAVVKFAPGAGLFVEAGGVLELPATAAEPIVMTALADDAIGGDTNLDGNASYPAAGSWSGVGGAGRIDAAEAVEWRYLRSIHAGELPGDDVWRSETVHEIVDTVIVPTGATLRIEAGAILKFHSKAGLVVRAGGHLVAEGGPSLPVVFTSLLDDSRGGDTNGDGTASTPHAGDWAGLSVEGTLVLEHGRLQYGGDTEDGAWNAEAGGAVTLGNSASAVIRATILRDVKFDGILSTRPGLEVENSLILNADRGVVVRPPGTARLVNCLIDRSRIGGFAHGGELVMLNCSVTNYSERGLVFEAGTGAATVRHCNVWSPTSSLPGITAGVDGNRSVEPGYRDPASGDYRLVPGSRLIDAGDGEVAPPTDFFGAPRTDDPHMPNTGVASANGVFPEMGPFEHAEEADSPFDLAVNRVSGPAAAMPGEAIRVEWEVVNHGVETIATPWTDAVYLVADDPFLGARVRRIGEVTISEDLEPRATMTVTRRLIVPLAFPGTWRLEVRTNVDRGVFEGVHAANNRRRSTTTLELAVPTLEFGRALEDVLEAGGHRVWELVQPAGEALQLRIAPADAFLLGVGIGQVRDPRVHATDASNGLLTIPAAASERSVFVSLASQTEAPLSFRLEAVPAVFELLESSPATGTDAGWAPLVVRGSGFRDGMEIALQTSAGNTVASAPAVVTAADEAHVRFDLGGFAPAAYTVVIAQDGMVRALPDALTVTPGEGPGFWAELRLPPSVRADRRYTAHLDYGNAGDTAMPAPYIQVYAEDEGTLLRLDASQPFVARPLEFFALGAEAPVSLLEAGESGTVSFQLRTPRDLRGELRLLYGVNTEESGTLPWAELLETYHGWGVDNPARSHVLAHLQDRIGSTWEGFFSRLRGHADYLDRFGQHCPDLFVLASMEVQRAAGFLSPVPLLARETDLRLDGRGSGLAFQRRYYSNLPARFRLGPWGRGWTHAYAFRLEYAGPKVARMTLPNGADQFFLRQGDGWVAFPDTPGLSLSEDGDESVVLLRDGTALRFDIEGRLQTVTGRRGHALEFSWLGERLIRMRHDDGPRLDLLYAGDRLAEIRDDRGRAVTYHYTDGLLTSVRRHDGREFHYAYHRAPGAAWHEALASVEDPAGVVRHFAYDQRGRLVSSAVNDEGMPLRWSYGAGGEVSVSDAEGRTATAFLGPRGEIFRLVDPDGIALARRYDARGHLVEETRPDGTSVAFSHGPEGFLAGRTDASGNQVSFRSTARGELLAATDARDRTLGYERDGSGRVTAIVHPDGSRERFARAANGDLHAATNRRGGTIVDITYDAQGRLLGKTWPDGRTFTYTYHPVHGELTSASDSASGSILFSYEESTGFLRRVDYPDGGWFEFAYDDAGRLVSRTGDDGVVEAYRYDDLGRLAAVLDGSLRPLVACTYDRIGRLASVRKGNGTAEHFIYNHRGYLEQLSHRNGAGEEIASFSYEYDILGRRQAMSTPSGRHEFRYDARGQLIQAEMPDGWSAHYRYDAAGNRILAREAGRDTLASFNAVNGLVTWGDVSCEHDADGNLTAMRYPDGSVARYRYDCENRPLSYTDRQGVVTRFHYNALSQLASWDRGGVVTRFDRDPFRPLRIARIRTDGVPPRHLVWGHWLVGERSGDSLLGHGRDGIGHVAVRTDADGAVTGRRIYRPFGQQVSGPNDLFGFVGVHGVLMVDADHALMGRRLYHLPAGRFLQPDPTGLAGGDLNLYRYAANDPVNRIDPTGNQTVFELLIICGVIVIAGVAVVVLLHPSVENSLKQEPVKEFKPFGEQVQTPPSDGNPSDVEINSGSQPPETFVMPSAFGGKEVPVSNVSDYLNEYIDTAGSSG